jgi:hypothetical protein
MTLDRFPDWLDSQFDAVEADQVAPAAAITETERHALRLGAGCIAVPDARDKRSALDYIGRLLSWCRETDTSDKLLWDSKEVARRLSISPSTLWSLTKCGRIKSVRIGHAGDKDKRRLVRYTPAAIQQYVAEQQISA